MSRVRVAVLGAGPYGLAVAAHLRAHGTSYRIFGRAMDSWLNHMPEGMFLKSEGFASNISDPAGSFTLRRFCEARGRTYGDIAVPVSIDTFTAYGLWFQQELVPGLEAVDVTAVHRTNGGFSLELSSGETAEADRVVVASGLREFAFVPPRLDDLEPDLATHTFEHATFSAFAGKKVAVVGAGQSALESAVLLRESGARPRLLVRAASIRWNPRPAAAPSLTQRLRAPTTGIGASWKLWAYMAAVGRFRHLPETTRVRLVRETLGPSGGWWLRDRFENFVELAVGHTLVSAVRDGQGARLTVENGQGRTTVCVDHVFAGTGFRVDVDRVPFLPEDLRRQIRRVHGAPRLNAHFESSVRGLYFVGLPAAHTFGPVMRFVCGSGFAARRVAAHAH